MKIVVKDGTVPTFLFLYNNRISQLNLGHN